MNHLSSESATLPEKTVRQQERLGLLLSISIVVTAVLYAVPVFYHIAYPMLLLSTYAHEMGHGIAAMVVGGRFEALLLHADGSGAALMVIPATRTAAAISSAGGLLGAPIVAAILLVLGTRRAWAKPVLIAMAVLSVVIVAWVIRTSFGVFFVLGFAGICVAIARLGTAVVQQFWVIFVATQLGLSVFSRGSYLFSPYADTATGRMPSDVMQISEALFAPYWFWGALIALMSAGVLFWAVWIYLRAARRPTP